MHYWKLNLNSQAKPPQRELERSLSQLPLEECDVENTSQVQQVGELAFLYDKVPILWIEFLALSYWSILYKELNC